MLNAIILALRLTAATDPRSIATEACAETWETDSEGYYSCVDGLRAWAIESHDRPGPLSPGDVRWPDAAWAGEQEWIID
jgi:hypothetical protein